MKKSTMAVLLALAAVLIAAGLVLESAPGFSGGTFETLYTGDESPVREVRAELRNISLRVYVNQNGQGPEVYGSGRAAKLVSAVFEDGTLLLTEREPSGLARLFPPGSGDDYAAVWLPYDFAGTLTLDMGSGELFLSGLDLSGASALLTASSGEVSVYDCRLGGLGIAAGSGDVWMGDLLVPGGGVSVTSLSGRISIGSGEMGSLTVHAGSGGLWADRLRAETAEILGSSGAVSLSSCDIGELTTETLSGGIYIDRIRAGNLALTAGSGNVTLAGGEADAVSVTTGSGNISLDRFRADRADLSAQSGDIGGTLSGRTGEPEVRCSAGSGDVSLIW